MPLTVGQRGPAGPDGYPGKDGSDGLQGRTGAIGARGKRGEPGEVGRRGERGAVGSDGPPGGPGPTGNPGPDGPEGIGEGVGDPVTAAETIEPVAPGNYFHVVGSTPISYMTTAGFEDGYRLTLLFEDSIILRASDPSPPAGSLPFELARNNDAPFGINGTISLRLDETIGAWREVGRTRGHPIYLPGLVLLLDANLGVGMSGADVVTWDDQSGLGNDVHTGGSFEGVAYAAPSFVSSSMGGQPAVKFQSGEGMFRTANNLMALGNPRTVLTAFKAAINGGSIITMRSRTGGYTSNTAWMNFGGTNNVHSNDIDNSGDLNTLAIIAINTGSEWVTSHRLTTTTAQIRINGTFRSTNAANKLQDNSASPGFLVGADYLNRFINELCFLAVYDRVISSEEEAAALIYMESRFRT